MKVLRTMTMITLATLLALFCLGEALAQGSWELLQDGSGYSPGLRKTATAIYDPVNHHLVVFGGATGRPPTYLSDVWAYDIASGTWEMLHPGGPGAPCHRREISSSYDPIRHRMIIFAGHHAWPTGFNDAWAFDLSTNTWELLHDGSGVAPIPRDGPTNVYDPDGDRIIIFGGRTGVYDSINDTWAFDFTTNTWALLDDGSGVAPETRGELCGFFDDATRTMVIFGGRAEKDLEDAYYNDVWAFDPADNTWEQLHDGEGIAPIERSNYVAGFEPVSRVFLVFAGLSYVSGEGKFALNDVWAFSLEDRSWVQLHDGTDTAPATRFASVGAYDPIGQRLLVHGGVSRVPLTDRKDLWVFTPELEGVIEGTVLCGGAPLGGVIVDLYSEPGLELVGSQVADTVDGGYSFTVDPGSYVVEIVVPLGYTPADGYPASVSITLGIGDIRTVDFLLNQVVASAEARSRGYWKHQYKVYDSGRGNAHESEADLEAYQATIFGHFHERSDAYAIRIEGVTFSAGPDVLTFDDALATLSARGNAGMHAKACSQYLALLLNVVSGKVGTYHEATEDGVSVSQVITYVGDLLEDDDPANDELAKDLAEYVNENQLIPTGLVPLWTPNVAFVGPRRPLVSFALPNPARGMTRIAYSTNHAVGPARLDIHDVAGRRVRTLTAEHDAGSQSRGIVWRGVDDSGRPVAAGIYFYTLTVGGMQSEGKVVLMK